MPPPAHHPHRASSYRPRASATRHSRDERLARIAERDWGSSRPRSSELRADRAEILDARAPGGCIAAIAASTRSATTTSTLQGPLHGRGQGGGPGAHAEPRRSRALHGAFVWDHRAVEITVHDPSTPGRTRRPGARTQRLDAATARGPGDPGDLARPDRTRLRGRARRRGAAADGARDAEPRLGQRGELAEVLIRLGPASRLAQARTHHLHRSGADAQRPRGRGARPHAPGGLAHPEVNEPLLLDSRRGGAGLRWPEQRLVVEADGAAWHDHRLAREDDAERQAILEAHGDHGAAGHLGPSDRAARSDARPIRTRERRRPEAPSVELLDPGRTSRRSVLPGSLTRLWTAH
jgi:hypothetical protein